MNYYWAETRRICTVHRPIWTSEIHQKKNYENDLKGFTYALSIVDYRPPSPIHDRHEVNGDNGEFV